MPSQIEVRREVAKRLKAARGAAGYTLAENFCKTHNLPLEQYLRHEDGDSIMRVSQAMRYAQLLNTSLQWLMLGNHCKNLKL
jgi:hypothetical protein